MAQKTKRAACALAAIGAVRHSGRRQAVVVAAAWRPALHLLDEFSHVLVLLTGDDGRPQAATVRVRVVAAAAGVVEVDRLAAADGDPVWDIKPYFPVEDRVRGAKDWAWREEAAAAAPAEFPAQAVPAARTTLAPLGEIRVAGGATRMLLPDLPAAGWRACPPGAWLRVFWWFDRFDRPKYRTATQCNPPYEQAPRTGIFATRSPVRPNPIGCALVRVIAAEPAAATLLVEGADALDCTPVLAVRPYVPEHDRVREPRVPAWVRHWQEWKEDELADDRPPVPPGSDAVARLDGMLPPAPLPPVDDRFFAGEAPVTDGTDRIVVRGARQHNLQGFDCAIPARALTVITGVSGSGKSSLAFDTLYAESQRRFMDSISTMGRQAFEQFERPAVDGIANLPPAVAIEQKTIGRNPRSTVGTMTEIYDYLRLLFARLGVRHCPACGRAVRPLTPEAIVARLAALPAGTTLRVRAHGRDAAAGTAFRAPVDRPALAAAVRAALADGDGALCATVSGEELLLAVRQACYHCRRPFFMLTSSVFSFNHPQGMCPDCQGLGRRLTTDPARIVTEPDRSLLDGASPWWGDLRRQLAHPTGNWMKTEVFALAAARGVDLEQPWSALPEQFRHELLHGTGDEAVTYRFVMARGRKGTMERPVSGAIANIERLFRSTAGEGSRQFYLQFMSELPCRTCHGERLAAEGRMTTLAGSRYPEIATLTVADLLAWVEKLPARLTTEERAVGGDMLREIRRRLRALVEVGVAYLTLDRTAPTLSGGEAQRIRLACQLGGGLTNLLYVLDEPSIGLHPRDHARMLAALARLRDAGNTVVVVEHDAATMRAADWLLDLGPGAGERGGRLMAAGTPDAVMRDPQSLTGAYLAGRRRVAESLPGGPRRPTGWLTLREATLHNLRRVTVDFPLGVFACVTGVSGSGKSSLVAHTLAPALARRLQHAADEPGPHAGLDGLAAVARVVNITQAPIGRTPRSNPATYTGLFDDIRALFAATEAARSRGWDAKRFSFNSADGRCPACAGDGRKRIEMHFLPDVWVECPACHGRRFNDETLAVRYAGLNIAEVLDLDIAAALQLFAAVPKLAARLRVMAEVGLDYLRLGQSATTLSGGEAQRVKLAFELSRPSAGHTVYILDEPTSGLHFADIRNLIAVLRRIIVAGNSVLVIEHNLELIAQADWVIDLGPEGGAGGGEVVAAGTPAMVAAVERSHTGRCLRPLLAVSSV